MKEIIIDALLDTLKTLGIILIVYIAISFVETKLAKLLKKNKFSPLIGSAIGLIPQCGFSVISSDLYLKKYISLGTLIAVFISTSDEALPILLSNGSKYKLILLLLLIKFVVAVIFGYLIDLIHKPVLETDPHETMLIHKGCCHHEIEENNGFKTHFIHPLLHSLKISLYILIINLLFGIFIFYIGKDSINTFLTSNKLLAPLFASIVGLIPNCASSVILTELFINGSLSFASTMSGLICNAGLGLIYLYKNKKNIKNNILITIILLLISLFVGYILSIWF